MTHDNFTDLDFDDDDAEATTAAVVSRLVSLALEDVTAGRAHRSAEPLVEQARTALRLRLSGLLRAALLDGASTEAGIYRALEPAPVGCVNRRLAFAGLWLVQMLVPVLDHIAVVPVAVLRQAIAAVGPRLLGVLMSGGFGPDPTQGSTIDEMRASLAAP